MDVSIVIASWNAAAFLPLAIDCALAQKDVSLEILVCDDASTDATPDLMRHYDDPRIRYVRLAENGGPAAARNAGLAMAQGEWIMIFDADDAMEPARAARLISAGRSSGADVVADNFYVTGARAIEGRRLHIQEELDGSVLEIGLEDYISSNIMFGARPALGYLKPIFRRATLRRLGLRYDGGLRIGEDFALVAEILAGGGRFCRLRTADYIYHTHDGSISHRLRPSDLTAMIAFDRKFARRPGGLPPEAAQALAQHRRSLENALTFTCMVDAIKKRDAAGLFRAFAGNPRGAALFRIPLRDRWRRLRAGA